MGRLLGLRRMVQDCHSNIPGLQGVAHACHRNKPFVEKNRVSMEAPLQETRRLFEIGLQRLRSTLPSIVLTDLDDSEDGDGLRVFTNECNLKRFSSIDSLTFELSSSFDVSMFARNILRYSPGSLRELSVTAPEWEGTEEPWNILSLTRNFSTVKEITLFRCSTMFVHHSSPFASLKTLRLSEMNISLERSDFSLLVELEELAIDDICCEDTPAGDMITLESLLKIEVAGDCSTILKFLRAPRLKMVDASIFEDHEIQFICNHPTIRHLGIRDYGGTKDNTLKALATCLLSLEFLQIYSGFEDLIDWRAVGLTSQPFPKLNRIKYALSQHDPIPWKHLERLMEYRCRFNTMDPQIDALTEWTLVCPRGKTQEVYSEGPRKLIRECTFFEEDFDDSIRLCLSWSNGRKKTIVTR